MKRSVNCSRYKQAYTKQNNIKKYFFKFALQIIPGRPTYCRGVETVRGERSERRQRRIKRGEWVAAVDRCQGALSPKADVGHRNRTNLQEKTSYFRRRFLCSRYLAFRVGQRIVLPYKKCPVDTFRQKKAPTFRSRLCVRVTYLPGQSPAKYCRRTWA